MSRHYIVDIILKLAPLRFVQTILFIFLVSRVSRASRGVALVVGSKLHGGMFSYRCLFTLTTDITF